MKTQIDILRKTRANFLKFFDGFTEDQLMTIPKGFKNNILWNIGHAVVTHDLVVWGRSELGCRLPDEVIERYRKGSSPSPEMVDDIEVIKNELIRGADALEEVINSGDLPGYDPYETSFGYLIQTFSDAVNFNNTHEALHLGYAMAQKNTL